MPAIPIKMKKNGDQTAVFQIELEDGAILEFRTVVLQVIRTVNDEGKLLNNEDGTAIYGFKPQVMSVTIREPRDITKIN